MSSTTLRILLAALSIALGAWWGATWFAQQGAHNLHDASVALRLGALSEATVDHVSIVGPRDTIRLQREGKGWTVNRHRADSAAVARFWSAVHTARTASVVATGAAQHAAFGLSADSAWRVDFTGGGGTTSILVGTTGPRAGTSYVRFPTADSAYLLESDLRIRVALSSDDWRDRRILAVDTATVARIAIDVDGSRYTLRRAGARWLVDDDIIADSIAMRVLLSELARFRAIGFLEPQDSIAGKMAGGSIAAYAANGDTLGLVFLSRGGGDRWARVPGDPSIYRLAYYRVERVAPSRPRLISRRH